MLLSMLIACAADPPQVPTRRALPTPPAQGQHYALQVDDIQAAVATLRARGVEVDDPSPLAEVCWQANLTDPAGNAIELNQPM